MNDLISRQALKNALTDWQMEYAEKGKDVERFETLGAVIELVEQLPTIEPKRGKWVERGENDDGTHNIQCSACEAGYKSKGHANSIYTKQRFHFCPNCGADMRERSEE